MWIILAILIINGPALILKIKWSILRVTFFWECAFHLIGFYQIYLVSQTIPLTHYPITLPLCWNKYRIQNTTAIWIAAARFAVYR